MLPLGLHLFLRFFFYRPLIGVLQPEPTQVDPDLRRTVVVSTKFDTRLPQFSRAEDVERFLRPPARLLDTSILGGSPFFTSVPSGRVGHTRECVFRSDEHFRGVCMT